MPHRLAIATSRILCRNWARPHWRILYYHDVPAQMRETFSEQLDWFSDRFTWCSVSDGIHALKHHSLDRPLLSLTFDDGDRSVWKVVMPLLADRKIPACCYVVPDYVDQGRSYRDDEPRQMMTWGAVQEWLSVGNEVGSHTLTHAALPACSPHRRLQEIEWSQDRLQQRLGVPVTHFAYPWGQYDRECRRQLREGGQYASVATTQRGPMTSGHDPYALRRDRANPAQPPEDLEFFMRLADRLYCLRHFRFRRVQTYWKAHPEIIWDTLPVQHI